MRQAALPIRRSSSFSAAVLAVLLLPVSAAIDPLGARADSIVAPGTIELANATGGASDAGGSTAAELAQEARARWQALGGMDGLGPRSEIYELSQIVDRLLREHPKSREAMLARRGRLLEVDAQLLTTYADAWRAANPEAASAYGAPSASQQEAAMSLGGIGAAIAPPQTATVPSWFRAAPIAPTAPRAPKATAPTQSALSAVAPKRLTTRDLYERLKKTTVLVIQLGQTRNGPLLWTQHGTGSFIGPKTVLTNTHVVEVTDGVPAQYFLIVNRDLGVSRAVLRARAQAASGRGIDAAVLDVLDVSAETFLSFASDFTEGDEVVLSGFAGRANESDQAFIDLQEMVDSGVLPAAESIPSAKFSSGEIQSIYKDEQGEETIAAGVIASSGASGSSLTDYCGRMAGLYYSATRSLVELTGNTGRVDSVKYNKSVSAREVMNWLDSARVPYVRSEGFCPTDE